MNAEKAMADILVDQTFWDEQKSIMVARMQPVFLELFLTGAAMGANQPPARKKALQELPFDIAAVNTAAQQVIAEYTDQWWGYINHTDQETLRRALATAANEGLGVEWVMKEIEPLFGEQRAMLIAISETTNLMGMGAQQTYQQAGFTEWEWRTVRDKWVCRVCKSLQGKQFPMSETFSRQHPHCRCWPVPAGEPSAEALLTQSRPSVSFA